MLSVFKKRLCKSDKIYQLLIIVMALIASITYVYDLINYWDNSRYIDQLITLIVAFSITVLSSFFLFVAYNINPSKLADLAYYIGFIVAVFLVIIIHTDSRSALVNSYNKHISF